MPEKSTRDQAVAVAAEAVGLDRNGRYEEAMAKYIQCLEYFNVSIKYEKSEQIKEILRAKAIEYMERAEAIKKSLSAGSGIGGEDKNKPSSPTNLNTSDDESAPLTAEQLAAATEEMEKDLSKLIGMESVKAEMRNLCKTLQLDIIRKHNGQDVLMPIRHMTFTGNPGTGKTTIARIVGKLFKSLGISRNDHVVEVQKSDLVSGFVNQTGSKTREKIREASGGVLFVDEAYQLTDALSRGQSDMGGEAVDEMMRVMNDVGPDAVTFVFAGYRDSIQRFIAYNAGLQSRIRYTFHFDDYKPCEIVKILQVKIGAKGWKMSPEVSRNLASIIETGTTPELRSKYNGRLVDNVVQWAADSLNGRLPITASAEDLITLNMSDFQFAFSKFKKPSSPTNQLTRKPASRHTVEGFLEGTACSEYLTLFVTHKVDYATLLQLTYDDLKEIGMTEVGPRRRLYNAIEAKREETNVLLALNRAPSVSSPSLDEDQTSQLRGRLDKLKGDDIFPQYS
eukprot:TRINITY_DN1677_c2_g1_i1.p1 TRINITY_DN1677_c2_g1~~TRINITY_DN1677_c2_g1_i1.p1  ORF type:complete len:528 (+),score=107.95 TRINITY_DN1677_c2_g1_i1:64-1584(+)